MKVIAVCISEKRGTPKHDIGSCIVTPLGLKNDAHAGNWDKQVSLLADESIIKMQQLGFKVSRKSFAANIITEGMILHQLPIGTRLRINDVILEITHIGKEEIDTANIMTKEGIFTKVIQAGTVHTDDIFAILN